MKRKSNKNVYITFFLIKFLRQLTNLFLPIKKKVRVSLPTFVWHFDMHLLDGCSTV